MRKLIAVVLSVFCMVGCLLPMSALAAGFGDASTLASFQARSVSEDLAAMMVNGELFDLTDHPYDADAEPPIRVLSLYEYGYSDFSPSYDRYGDYSLYLYIYNPRNVPLATDRDLSVSLALGNGEYVKYPLVFLSRGGDGSGHDHLFYKFQIGITAKQLREGGVRNYRVSEVEFPETATSLNAEAYTVGADVTYTGYLNGYGSELNTLSSSVVDLQTIDLSVTQVTWRNDKNLADDGLKYQLNSVLFSVPESIIEECGDLQAIGFEFYRYNTGYVISFPTEKGYNLFKPYEGITLTEPTDDLPGLKAGAHSFVGSTAYYWLYNDRFPTIMPDPAVGVVADQLTYVFMSPKDADPDSIVESGVADHFNSLWQQCHSTGSFVGAGIFAGNKADHYEYHYLDNEDPDDAWQIGTFKPSIWTALGFGDELTEVPPIDYVTQSDIDAGLSGMYISEYYRDEVQSLLNTATAGNERLCVLRYDLTDYFALTVHSDSYPNEPDLWLTGDDDGGFVAKEDIYMDFDILSLTFRKDGVSTIIPAVMSPVNIIPDLETPTNGIGGADGLDWWMWLAIGVVALIALIILMPFIPTVISLVVKVILLPFRLLAALFKGIGSVFQRKK